MSSSETLTLDLSPSIVPARGLSYSLVPGAPPSLPLTGVWQAAGTGGPSPGPGFLSPLWR